MIYFSILSNAKSNLNIFCCFATHKNIHLPFTYLISISSSKILATEFQFKPYISRTEDPRLEILSPLILAQQTTSKKQKGHLYHRNIYSIECSYIYFPITEGCRLEILWLILLVYIIFNYKKLYTMKIFNLLTLYISLKEGRNP